MGNLTESAQKRFRKSRRVAVPEWYQSAQWLAVVLIPIILVVSYVTKDNPVVAPQGTSNASAVQVLVPGGDVAGNVDSSSGNADASGSGTAAGSVSVSKPGGGSVSVPASALQAAKAAGLASYTGNWVGVPVDGSLPRTQRLNPEAKIGKALAYAVSDAAITFAFQLDRDGNGTWDESFQVSVVNVSDRWVFPVLGA